MPEPCSCNPEAMLEEDYEGPCLLPLGFCNVKKCTQENCKAAISAWRVDNPKTVSVEPEPHFLMALQIATSLKEAGISGVRHFPDAGDSVQMPPLDVATLAVAIEPILKAYGQWFASKIGGKS